MGHSLYFPVCFYHFVKIQTLGFPDIRSLKITASPSLLVFCSWLFRGCSPPFVERLVHIIFWKTIFVTCGHWSPGSFISSVFWQRFPWVPEALSSRPSPHSAFAQMLCNFFCLPEFIFQCFCGRTVFEGADSRAVLKSFVSLNLSLSAQPQRLSMSPVWISLAMGKSAAFLFCAWQHFHVPKLVWSWGAFHSGRMGSFSESAPELWRMVGMQGWLETGMDEIMIILVIISALTTGLNALHMLFILPSYQTTIPTPAESRNGELLPKVTQ